MAWKHTSLILTLNLYSHKLYIKDIFLILFNVTLQDEQNHNKS